MAWLLQTCGLQNSHPSLTLIRQNSGVDGSFLIASLLGQRLKTVNNSTILLVSTAHNFDHYSAASAKLAINLETYRKNDRLQVLDLTEELAQNFPQAIPNLNVVLERIQHFFAGTPNSMVVFDDLSFFLNFDATESQLIDFVEAVLGSRAHPEEQGVILKLNNAELYGVLGANLDDLADTDVLLEPMSSGNFVEVDGRMTVRGRKAGGELLINVKESVKPILYKVNNRDVKTILPGQLGIKI